MVARKLLMAVSTAAVSVALLAHEAAGAEAPVAHKELIAADVADAQRFRAEIDSYVRALNAQLKATFSEDLRRELAPKVVLATHSLRTRG
jgi:methionine-rich copper-binding protein CopC